jgi:hypothetical protein
VPPMLRQAVSFVERLLRWRSADALSIPGEERRVWIRHPSTGHALCQATPGENRQPARVKNISRGGVNLVTRSEFEPGMLLSVELPGSTDDGPAMALAYVIHVSELPDGEWSLGCSFAAELSDEDLERLGTRRVKSTPPDKRTWVRFPCNLAATYRLVGEDERQGHAQATDISPSGVGLSVAEPIEVGSLLNLELQAAPSGQSLNILACVVRTMHKGHEHAIGCNFIRELTDAELDACCQVGAHR